MNSPALDAMPCGEGLVSYRTSEVQCPQRVALRGIVVKQSGQSFVVGGPDGGGGGARFSNDTPHGHVHDITLDGEFFEILEHETSSCQVMLLGYKRFARRVKVFRGNEHTHRETTTCS